MKAANCKFCFSNDLYEWNECTKCATVTPDFDIDAKLNSEIKDQNKQTSAIELAIFYLIFNLFWLYFNYSFNLGFVIPLFIYLISIWIGIHHVLKITKAKNIDSSIWIIITIISPFLAFLSLHFKKNNFINVDFVKNSAKENAISLGKKSIKLFNSNDKLNAILYAEYALELDVNEEKAIETLTNFIQNKYIIKSPNGFFKNLYVFDELCEIYKIVFSEENIVGGSVYKKGNLLNEVEIILFGSNEKIICKNNIIVSVA